MRNAGRFSAVIVICMMVCLPRVYSQADAPQSRNVYFSNKDKSIRFGGTLTIPANRKSFPAVVLLSGTGKQDRDGTMAGHKMFKALADSLAAMGVAVLRTDDRGTGETNGVYETTTTKDFADDALAAINYLRLQPGVTRTGLIGHSEGGAAAIIAAAASKNVAFVITLAGLATSGIEALKLQNSAIIDAAPISAYDKNRHHTITTLMFDTAYRYAYTPELEPRLRATYAAWKHADDSAYAKDKAGEEDHMRFFLESYIRQATGPWYQYHLRHNPAPFLQQIKVPFLALNGDKDIMVPYKENLAAIAGSGNPQVTVKVLPGLNHLFLHCESCTNEELPRLKGDIAPEAWTAIKNWMQSFL
ncbi:alpha/beta hydrolase [Chitinophaga ginsengisegetis]|uniref:alpha/beta hydrolase family protein n=1 Tax=Chitinophaga ginsengisegetis TaxID=393003 RepID=UPI003420069F